MPPSGPTTLPRSGPQRKNCHKCLRDWPPNVEVYVKRRFPEYVVLEALEKAKSEGLSAIYGELHDKMKPEEMTSARRRAWLLTVAGNAALTVLRRRRTVPLRDDDMLPSAPTSSLDPHERQLVVEAVQKLPLASREVIEAAYFEGLSGLAAAERWECPRQHSGIASQRRSGSFAAYSSSFPGSSENALLSTRPCAFCKWGPTARPKRPSNNPNDQLPAVALRRAGGRGAA